MTTPGAVAPGPPLLGLLAAPHARLGRRGMLALTALQAAAGLALSRAGVRFDGALDVHRTWQGGPVPAGVAALDQAASLLVAGLAAAAVLGLWGHRRAARDAVLLLGVARVPLVLVAPFVLALPTPAQFAAAPAAALAPAPGVLAAGLAGFVGFVWAVTLLATGLREATGARGGRLAAVTAAVAAAAEVAGKLALAVAG